jgi:hypothetical protein
MAAAAASTKLFASQFVQYHALSNYASDLGLVLPGGVSISGQPTNSQASQSLDPVAILASLDSSLGAAGHSDLIAASVVSNEEVESNNFTVSVDPDNSTAVIVQNQTLVGDGGPLSSPIGTDVVSFDPTNLAIVSEIFTSTSGIVYGFVPNTDTSARPSISMQNGETLFLQNGTAFEGAIDNFQQGDTIDLGGVTATEATLGANNLLTATESGGTFTLQFDPTQNFANDVFSVSSDGNGGTDVTVRLNPFTTLVDQANGINNGGTIVGDSYLENNGSYTTLNSPFVITFFDGVNDSGALVGTYFNMPGSINPKSSFGYVDENGVYTTLDDPQGDFTERGTTYSSTLAYGINDSDDVVGYYETNAVHGFIESGGIYTTIDDPNAGPSIGWPSSGVTEAYGINNKGAIVGIFDNATGEHGFVESGGIYTTIDDPNASGFTEVNAINDGGTIVGSYADNGVRHGFVESGGVFTTLDVPNATATSAQGINNGGTIVGFYEIGQAAFGFEYIPPAGVTCFRTGTRIATDSGETRVETLEVGDLVKTELSGLQAVKWIGHRRINCARHLEPSQVWPVRVHTGAFGEGLPRRDLWLSPDHAVYISDVLIPIKYLINESTIVQEPSDEVTYYHVELDQHDVLLAEGLPAETYLDTGDRSKFANGGGPIALHPDFSVRMWEAMGCASLVVTGPVLASIRTRLLQHAAQLGKRRHTQSLRAA